VRGGFVLLLVVAPVLFIAFGLNTLRGPIRRAVTNATGRELRGCGAAADPTKARGATATAAS